MRLPTMKKYNLPNDFEFSQSYLFFHDKLEKSNFFLENIIDTADEAVGSRIVQHLLSDPISDGGQVRGRQYTHLHPRVAPLPLLQLPVRCCRPLSSFSRLWLTLVWCLCGAVCVVIMSTPVVHGDFPHQHVWCVHVTSLLRLFGVHLLPGGAVVVWACHPHLTDGHPHARVLQASSPSPCSPSATPLRTHAL